MDSKHEDRSGALWFVTSGDGVSRYDEGRWRTFTTADGLASMAVSGMLTDQGGALWFATMDGVNRYDGANWRTFTTANGLASNYVSSMFEERNGALWFVNYGVGVIRSILFAP